MPARLTAEDLARIHGSAALPWRVAEHFGITKRVVDALLAGGITEEEALSLDSHQLDALVSDRRRLA
jgi:hypothetical protein